MPKKLTIEYVKAQFENVRYELLSNEYVNNKRKLDYICPNGHIHNITWHEWQDGCRCYVCGIEKSAIGRRKYTIKYIKDHFSKEGYILLTTKYRNNEQKLEYVCPNNHYGNITWDHWQRGVRCSLCYNAIRGHTVRHSIEFIKSEFEKEGYQLLTTEYKNSNQKLEFICPNNHTYGISYGSWYRGYRCAMCSGMAKLSIDFIRNEFGKEGYILLTNNYINNKQKLKYICSNGHKSSISWNSWQQGQRCSKCKAINMVGEGNHQWKGGISCEPYCDAWADKEYKESIKERDNYKCLNPYCSSKNPNDLTIHHIDYNKKNCSPDNLITLWRSCNSRANKDRNWHSRYYIELLKIRGV